MFRFLVFRTRYFRTIVLFAVVLSTLSFSTPGAFAKPPIPQLNWALYQTPCTKAELQSYDSFRAGHFGYFYFGDRPITGCGRAPVISCTEPARVYPMPGDAPMALTCDPTQSGCDRQFIEMVEPWIYIPDLAVWHGQMVDAVIRATTDPEVDTMISIMNPRPGHEGVTDEQVVKVLAELAEAIDFDGIPKPTTINTSFGRLHEPGDATSADCDQTSCYAGALSCQLARLMAYLTRQPTDGTPRTLAIGSAGNDQVALVPSAFDEIFSTGMVDSTALAAGADDPAWETPPGSDALLPGNGLCLEMLVDYPGIPKPVPTEIPLPVGSSFSAGAMSGIAADLIHDDPEDFLAHLDQGGRWVPRQVCDDNGCAFVLTNGVATFASPSGNGSTFLSDAIYRDPTQCGLPRGLSLPAVLVPARFEPTVQYLSLPELTADIHGPTPDSFPCLPCVVEHRLPLQGPVATKATQWQSDDGHSKGRSQWIDLAIDLHGRWPLDPSLILHALFLRIGSELKQLSFDDSMHLDLIQQGDVGYLEVSGTFDNFDLSTQPSMIAVVSRPPVSGNQREFYWKSIAMVNRP